MGRKFNELTLFAFTLLKTFLGRAEIETPHFISPTTYTVSLSELGHYEEPHSSLGLFKGFGIELHLCMLLRGTDKETLQKTRPLKGTYLDLL